MQIGVKNPLRMTVQKVSGREHWEGRLTSRGDIYRHDNAPHRRWAGIATFPKHFHDGDEDNVVESYISEMPEDALSEFLRFVRNKLLSKG